MLAKVVNDDAGCLTPRSVFTSIASLLAPTGLAMKQTWCEHPRPLWELACQPTCVLQMPPIPVGASTLAMVVNDDAGCLMPRGVLETIASMLAPTGLAVKQK
jgi:hypothetical protein